MVLTNRSNTKINEFKLLISNSYRNHNYDIRITKPSIRRSKDGEDERIVKYLYENNINISLLCKSIGQLEVDIEDIKTEVQGREQSTGGKFKYKSPITISFFDVILNDGESKPIFLSDVFKYWIERWNYEHPTLENTKLYTRRRYRDDNTANIYIGVYSGVRMGAKNSQDIEQLTYKTNEINTINQSNIGKMKNLLSSNNDAFLSFDRWKYFWTDKNIIKDPGQFAFTKALNGFGGASQITLHGMINGFVFSILKGLSIGEMFYELSQDIKDNKFEETASQYAAKSAVALTGSQLYMEKPAMEVDDVIKDTNDSNQTSLNRNMFNEEEFQTNLNSLLSSRSLNSGLMNQLIQLRKTPEFNKFKTDMNKVIDKFKFENEIQKDTLKKLLGFIGGEETNIKELGDSIDLIGNFITEEGLQSYKEKLEQSIESKGIDFLNEEKLDIIKEIISKLDGLLSSNRLNDPLYNEEFKNIIRDILAKLDSLTFNDDFIDIEEMKHYFSRTNFDRDAVGWHIKSRNVITGLFAPATLFVRVLQAKDNLKSVYNLIGVGNGWDDFINTDTIPESVLMRSGFTIKQFIEGSFNFDLDDIYGSFNEITSNSTNNKSEFNTKLLPGEAYNNNLTGSYLDKSDEFRPVQSGYYKKDQPATKILKNIILTRAYPTSVTFQPALNNDSVGLESIPVIDITFNFYDIKNGE